MLSNIAMDKFILTYLTYYNYYFTKLIIYNILTLHFNLYKIFGKLIFYLFC